MPPNNTTRTWDGARPSTTRARPYTRGYDGVGPGERDGQPTAEESPLPPAADKSPCRCGGGHG